MLMRLYFTEFLLAFCAVHLVHVAKYYISGKIEAYRQKRMPAAAPSDMYARGVRNGDWYVYFHRSELVGEYCRRETPRFPDRRDGAMRPKASADKGGARKVRDTRIAARPDVRLACS